MTSQRNVCRNRKKEGNFGGDLISKIVEARQAREKVQLSLPAPLSQMLRNARLAFGSSQGCFVLPDAWATRQNVIDTWMFFS